MDNSYESRKRELIAEITVAFDGVSRQDGVSLRESQVIDDYGSNEERAQARAQDTQARWQDVPDEDIGWSDAVLNFLDAKGFRYYIPAFIVWYLKYVDIPNDWNDNPLDSVVSHLARPSLADNRGLEHCKILTQEQSKVIAHFLVFEAEREAKFRAEFKAEQEADWRRWVANGEVSQETADVYFGQVRQESASSSAPRNDAQRALDRYWHQFL